MAKRVDKPIRLYMLAVFIVVAYGLMPLVSVFPITGGIFMVGPMILPFNGSILVLGGPDGQTSFVLVLISLILSAFSAFSAVVAALGFKEGRSAALAFVTLDVLWWTFLVIMAVIQSEDVGPAAMRASLEILIPPLWLAFIWWNYTRPDVRAYYAQQSELNT